MTASPSEFDIDVRAFCVLFHAALEGFMEGAAHYIYKHAFDKYIFDQEITRAFFSIYFYSPELCVGIDDETRWEKLYDNVRNSKDKKVDGFMSVLLKNNHGASPKYMKKMLMRLGVDLDESWQGFQSLGRLVDARGEFAHWDVRHTEGRKHTKVVSPEDALEYARDCLDLAGKIVCRGASSSGDKESLNWYLVLVMKGFRNKIISQDLL
ncbi:HEPN domain-containing protein [Halomonas cupida]|uniref:HEPN domain-containing protein n=1 Tax=Halomonas cupida TaxID=44933 RepID=UPI003A9357F8